MALTELQRPTKATFYLNIQAAATEIDRLITKWRNLVEFVDLVDGTELDAMGVPAGTGPGTVRADLVDFRNVVNEFIQLFDGNPVTPAKSAGPVVDRIRLM